MSYRKLGGLVKSVEIKNTDGKITKVIGVSITKNFIPSVANLHGVDLTKYNLIKKNQFACKLMSVGRDLQLPIDLYKEDDYALISSAYYVFEVQDENVILPDYLNMWFRISESDRWVGYISGGDVRGGISWDMFMEMDVNVPSIEKQREIVAQFEAVANKIKVNEAICEKLEATAQALYKQWFMDFEFPNNEGQPYKSSGGAMVFNQELEKEIPEDWEVKSLKEITDKTSSGSTPSRDDMSYWMNGDIPWLKTGELNDTIVVESEEKITKKALKESSVKIIPKDSLLIAMYGEGKTKGSVGYLKFDATTNQACCALISSNVQIINFLYYAMKANKDEILKNAIGGAQPNLSKKIVDEFRLLIPTVDILEKFDLNNYILYQESLLNQNQKLTQLQSLLLSRLATLEE